MHIYIYISIYPRCSMYGICTYIYPKNHPNVGKYSIHGASGYVVDAQGCPQSEITCEKYLNYIESYLYYYLFW